MPSNLIKTTNVWNNESEQVRMVNMGLHDTSVCISAGQSMETQQMMAYNIALYTKGGFKASVLPNKRDLVGISDSLVSTHFPEQKSMPQKKNNKNVRNFNCLYEVRAQSKKLREMQEKFRIGDGRAKDRFLNSRG